MTTTPHGRQTLRVVLAIAALLLVLGGIASDLYLFEHASNEDVNLVNEGIVVSVADGTTTNGSSPKTNETSSTLANGERETATNQGETTALLDEIRRLRLRAQEDFQEIRELKGAVANLQKKEGVAVHIQAAIWADAHQALQRAQFRCRGPNYRYRNVTSYAAARAKELWRLLAQGRGNKTTKNAHGNGNKGDTRDSLGNLCGCLQEPEPLRYVKKEECVAAGKQFLATEKSRARKTEDDEDGKCPTYWIVSMGDSTQDAFGAAIIHVAQTYLNFTRMKWISPDSSGVITASDSEDDGDDQLADVKRHMTRLREVISTSGRVGVHLALDDDFGYVSGVDPKVTLLFSYREGKGLSLSRWEAALQSPENQLVIPNLAGQGPMQMHPTLDEPYFVNVGAQARDFFPGCDFKGGAKRPDLFLASSALWDTHADANMEHRNERYRCGMKLNAETMMQLYESRIKNLFNRVCETGNADAFVWRLSSGSPRFVSGGKAAFDFYGSIEPYNDVAKKTAATTGLQVTDFHRVFLENQGACADRVHPESWINVAGVREMIVTGNVGNGRMRRLFARVDLGEVDRDVASARQNFEARKAMVAQFIKLNRLRGVGSLTQIAQAEAELARLAKIAEVSVKSLRMSSSWEV